MPLIATPFVALSVCLYVTLVSPAKRLNLSTCGMGCGLRWAHITLRQETAIDDNVWLHWFHLLIHKDNSIKCTVTDYNGHNGHPVLSFTCTDFMSSPCFYLLHLMLRLLRRAPAPAPRCTILLNFELVPLWTVSQRCWNHLLGHVLRHAELMLELLCFTKSSTIW